MAIDNKRDWWRYAWAVGALHILGIASLATAVIHHPDMLGLGLLAYTFGLRHAFDVDHIAAIDNTVRKLMQQGKRSSGVGFYFSLGHSSVVFIMAVATVLATKWVQHATPRMAAIGGAVGTAVSGLFLLLIGSINLLLFFSIFRLFRRIKTDSADLAAVEPLLQARGFFNRWLGQSLRLVNESWHIYPIGFLFGLGFDTATEVALLAISAEASNQAVSIPGLISLPILFAAGMSLMDTFDGILMTGAYNWAFITPVRKLYYNLAVTGIAVMVALGIGLIEVGQLAVEELNLHGRFWNAIEMMNIGWLGYVLVGLFIAVWLLSYAIWKIFRIEERWSMPIARDP